MTSKLKHTPGPWKYVNIGSHWNNKTIPSFEIQFGKDEECVVDHVYTEADARLIAAAPEMLMALIAGAKAARKHNVIVTAMEGIIERATGLSIKEVLSE